MKAAARRAPASFTPSAAKCGIRGQSEALLRWAISALPRSVAVPETELLAADYEAGIAPAEARATLGFRPTETRARLAAVRFWKLLSVRAIRLIADQR